MTGADRLGRDDTRGRFYSTAELASTSGVTPRTVRFYETRGLLKPSRAGAVRVFTHSDRARLQLILRGKRLGFSLDEIGEYLDLYGVDPDHLEQLNHVVDKSRERIAELEGKLQDLQATIKELRQIEHEALTRLRTQRSRRTANIQPFPKSTGTHAKGDRRHE
jgi:DNA-binding transcriptional MerR regulator